MRFGWAPVAAWLMLPAAAGAQQSLLVDQYLAASIPGLAVEPGVTVLSRARPAFDAPGVQLGAFTIRPTVDQRAGFDDNVDGTQSRRGSAMSETVASLRTGYSQSNTAISLTAGVDETRYLEQNAQSTTTWTAVLAGAHDFGRDRLSFDVAHLNLNQTARDLDVPLLARALPYRVDLGTLAYRVNFARAFLEPAVTAAHLDYSGGVAAGQPYAQAYRDRTTVEPSATLGYALAPRRNVVLVLRDAVAAYARVSPGAPRRDYNDASVMAGLDFTDGGPLRIRLLAGYETRHFTRAGLRRISAPVTEAVVVWTPTGLTTLTATLARRIEDAAEEAAVGVTKTAFGLTVDHEYRRNVLLQARGGLFRNDYAQGQGSQALATLGAGSTWLLNRSMRLEAQYDFTHRTSRQASAPGYAEDRFSLQLRLAL